MKVKLEMFFEQGMEGVEWIAYDTTKTGYEGIIDLKDGDRLIIPNVWEGIIKQNCLISRQFRFHARDLAEKGLFRVLMSERGIDTRELSDLECQKYCYEYYTQQRAAGYWCHWLQDGVEPDTWAQWFLEELEAEFFPNKQDEIYFEPI